MQTKPSTGSGKADKHANRRFAAARIKTGLLASVILLTILFGLTECGKDPDETGEKIATFFLYCPYSNGKPGCYVECARVWDKDGSGRIEPVEEPDYKTCTGRCDTYCDLTALLFM